MKKKSAFGAPLGAQMNLLFSTKEKKNININTNKPKSFIQSNPTLYDYKYNDTGGGRGDTHQLYSFSAL